MRAVATNTFRVATNAAEFLPQAEAALGFPIDIIGGHEEARLIYLGVAHVLPSSAEPRLVIDIGGGSTEFIIGRGLEPERLESLKVGCVGMTQRFFADGALSRDRVSRRRDARARRDRGDRPGLRPLAVARGVRVVGHRARARRDPRENGLSAGGITPDGLARLRKRMIGAGHVSRLRLEGLKPERAPVLAGGFAIMPAAIAELRVDRDQPGRRRAAARRPLRPARAARSTATRAS